MLSNSWSGVKWLDNEDNKRQEHLRRGKKMVTECVHTARTVHAARTVSNDTDVDAPCRGFESFSSIVAFFLGKQCTLTTIWSLSIDFFNMQDGRTLLTCPFLASWTAFVCACNGSRTRRASKRWPWAAEVMAWSRYVLRVIEVRHFQVLALERDQQWQRCNKRSNSEHIQNVLQAEKERCQVPGQKSKRSIVTVIALLAMILFAEDYQKCKWPGKTSAQVHQLQERQLKINPAGQIRLESGFQRLSLRVP